MKTFVGQTEFDSHLVSYRDLGYGSDPGRPLVPFLLSLPAAEFVQRCGAAILQFVADCREDDRTADESDLPELQAAGYPSPTQLVAEHPALLSELVVEYLYHDVLTGLLGENPPERCRFAVNQIADVAVDDRGVHLGGLGYAL